MQPIQDPGYELCYLGARQSVLMNAANPSEFESPSQADPNPYWLVWGRSALAVVVVVALTALGLANVALFGLLACLALKRTGNLLDRDRFSRGVGLGPDLLHSQLAG